MRAWLVAMALSSPILAPAPLEAQTAPGQVELFTLLEKGLKVRRDEERAFLRRVVREVRRGSLPEPLVKAVFSEARRKSENYPYFYFREMMIRLARQRGVRLV